MIASDAAKTDIVFVQNATTGNNAVIQSVVKTLKPGDSILMTSFTYGENSRISFSYAVSCSVTYASWQGLWRNYCTKSGKSVVLGLMKWNLIFPSHLWIVWAVADHKETSHVMKWITLHMHTCIIQLVQVLADSIKWTPLAYRVDVRVRQRLLIVKFFSGQIPSLLSLIMFQVCKH